MAEPLALVEFPDRKSAYGFVAELRRLRDLDALATLQVLDVAGETVVEVPPDMPSRLLSELAGRFGGRVPATDDERERLRQAVAAARQTASASRDRLRGARRISEDAAARVRSLRRGREQREQGEESRQLPDEGA
jgi:hypothetical protein